MGDPVQPSREGRACRTPLGLAPAALAVLLPKCPLCLATWGAVLTWLGVAPALYVAWLPSVTYGCVAATVCLLVWQARARRRYALLPLGLTGAALILMSKLWLDLPSLALVGLVLILVATLRRRPAPHRCEGGGTRSASAGAIGVRGHDGG